MTSDAITPDVRARLALVLLEKLGTVRARWLFGAVNTDDPAEVAVAALDRLRRGILPEHERAPVGTSRELVNRWRDELRRQDLDETLARHQERGIGLLSPLDARWPIADDPDPPVLVFHAGDLDLLQHPVGVAVVGTRRCTTVGRTVAYEFGRALAEADVAVISGLALGIDGAAHRGAVDAGGPVIGVVGSGIDVVYPGGNRELWNEVVGSGLLLSETPAGRKPMRWRFPARNRLIAGLSQGVVVVESHRSGGSLSTVDEAVDRGLPVFVVPGSVLSAASEGTNGLLVEGAAPVRHAADVLETLGINGFVPEVEAGKEPDLFGHIPTQSGRPAEGSTVDDTPLMRLILDEAATGPVHLDRLILASGATVSDTMVAVQLLVGQGRLLLDGSTVSRP